MAPRGSKEFALAARIAGPIIYNTQDRREEYVYSENEGEHV